MSDESKFDLAAAISRSPGPAPKALIQLAEPGAVFSVLDASITFPTDRKATAGARDTKPMRRVVVLQCTMFCQSGQPETLLVVPCSASTSLGVGDLRIPEGEAGFTGSRVIALTSLVQPILKSDLVKHHGNVSVDTLVELRRSVFTLLSLTTDRKFP